MLFIYRWLLDKKVPVADLDNILEKEEDGVSTVPGNEPELLPHHDKTTWLINCDRREAEAMLAGTEDGTFLVRPKLEEGDVYVLSIS